MPGFRGRDGGPIAGSRHRKEHAKAVMLAALQIGRLPRGRDKRDV